MKRFFIFVSVFSGLLAFVWFYVWISLAAPLLNNHLLENIALSFFVFTYSLQILRFILFRRSEESKFLIISTYVLLGLMSHLFFAALAKDFIWWALEFTQQNWVSYEVVCALALVLSLIASLWGTVTALKGPVVRDTHVFLKNWPKASDGFKIAQISDLHVGPVIKKDYVAKVVQKILNLKPDMIVLTGDIGDGQVSQLNADLEPLRQLQAPYGSYYVTGNHEYYWGAEDWIRKLSELGFQNLHNEGKLLSVNGSSLFVAGVPDISQNDSSPQTAMSAEGKEAQAKILLAHQPKSCFEAEIAGFELMICGHTHWGQFFPFTLLVGFFNPVSKALNQLKTLQVYVNAGTGFWGPPLRLGVPSEITLIHLRS